jgi:PAS domain S-box-containing protein
MAMMERDIQNYAQNIVDTVREPLLILDATLRVRSANRAFYQTFHVSPGETEGRLIYELGNGQWDIPDLRRLLEDIVPKSSVFNDFELEHTFPVIGRRVMLLNARKLQAGRHGELLVLAMEDVTARKRAEEALLEAGALQNAIFNSANFSSIATDEKGVIQIFNVGAERMLGYAAIEVVDRITPADISDPQEVIARAAALSLELATPITPGFEALVFKAARGIEDIYELTYIRKDGSRFPAVVSVTALRDDQNAIIGYLLIGTDNTARKQAEEALLKAGALQNAIFNSANFSSIATDEKGVIQIFNVGAERMLGYAAAEVMNKITPADISDPQEVITRAKALSAELGTTITPGFEALVFKASRGIEDIYELTYIRKDGSRFPAIVSVTALRDAQGGIIGYLLIGTDNTARKQVEAERMLLDQRVRDQQFYTRSLIESNIDALIATDPRGIITDVNKQMEALTGCTRDELIGAPFKDYFTNPERAEAGIKLVLGEGKVIDYELTARARDGKETVVSYSATTFHDRDRKLQGVFAAARDVTERKRYEQSLRLADQRKDEFLAMLAHELRNPLAPIRNSLEILSMPGVDAETAARTREMMGRQVQNLVRLVDDLLDVSRVMQGKIEQRREHVDLGSIVACAIETVQPLMEAQGHELTVTLPSKPLFLDADPVRLAQVVGNLLTNAAKYTEAKGRIALIATREGNEAVLRLQDNGIGIAADILPRIFELFVQVDHAATRSQGGLGIGLTLVKNLVEMHQGSIEAHSDGLGTGSEFVMRLPLSKDEGGRMKDESETEPIHPSSFILHPSKRLLVIDDNQDAANSLAMLLRMQGYEVRVAHSGAEALALTRSYTPQVVFLDIGMPGMDGYEVARKLRLQPGLHSVVLAAVTGWGQEEDRRRTTEAGFDHHLVKPPEPKAVQHVLAALGK